MDLACIADLAEEVARFYGYDKLETTLIRAGTTIGIQKQRAKIENKIKMF